MASTEPEHEHREEEEAPTNEDEDTGAQDAPIVKLEEIAVTTGEEDETSILDLKAKLYRFDKDGNPWKERAAPSVKFLKHKEHQVQEREKTDKIINIIHGLVFAKSKNQAVVSVPTMDPPSRVCSTPDSSCDFELSSSPPSTCHEETLVKAFDLAEIAHKWQRRVSGHPYVQHCVKTAEMLALIGADATVVAAGLLHDTLDDSFMSYHYVFKTCGAGVADLVKEVSRISHLSKLARDSDTASKTDEADYLHTMFLAKADARALLIKLADRLHNMRTLDALPEAKRHTIAKETLKIFAPLANHLGISIWKEELENLCFKHLHPIQHEKLSKLVVGLFGEKIIDSAIKELANALCARGISYLSLSGRQKSLYSIYSKMVKKKLKEDDIYDILGLRLIVKNVKDCHEALSVVRDLGTEVAGRFKDYIIKSKDSGYQSLHTVVRYENRFLEVQIRTEKMHEDAEFSFAAHWRYKEGCHKHSVFVLKWIEWARSVITQQCETMNSSYLDSDCGQGWPVFVIIIDKDKMSVQEFPANTKITDLLEKSRPGSRSEEELKPRLNFLPVNDPTCKLKMGDVLELNMLLVGILMSVQEFSADKTITDLLEKSRRGGSRSEEELKPRLNFLPVNDPMCKLKMGDVLELTSAQPQRSKTTGLTPTIRDKSFTTVCKERKYDRELAESSTALISG